MLENKEHIPTNLVKVEKTDEDTNLFKNQSLQISESFQIQLMKIIQEKFLPQSLKQKMRREKTPQDFQFENHLRNAQNQFELNNSSIEEYVEKSQTDRSQVKSKQRIQETCFISKQILKDFIYKQNNQMCNLSNNENEFKREKKSIKYTLKQILKLNEIKKRNLDGLNFKEINNIKKMIQQVRDHNNLLNQNKILGGGGCGSLCSKIKTIKVQKEEKDDDNPIRKVQQLKDDKFINSGESKQGEKPKKQNYSIVRNRDFMKKYENYISEERIKGVVDNSEFSIEIRKIVEKCLFDNRENIIKQIYKDKVTNIFNLIIHYAMCCLNEKNEEGLQKDIDDLINLMKQIQKHFEVRRNIYPCLDLYLYIDFLIILNQEREGLDKANQPLFFKIAEFALQLVKIASCIYNVGGAVDILLNFKEHGETMVKVMQDLFKHLTKSQKSIEEGVAVASNLYNIDQNGKLFQQISAIWISKYQTFNDEFLNLPVHKELIFFIKILSEQRMTNQNTIKFIFIQINSLLEKDLINQNDNFKQLSSELQANDQTELILDFAQQLQKKKYTNKPIDFIKSLVNLVTSSSGFRFLQIQILLKLVIVIQHFGNKEIEKSILINLCLSYLSEKDDSVKIVFKDNKMISKFIQEISKSADLQQKVIEENKIITKQLTEFSNEEQVNNIQENIDNVNDVEKQIANTLIKMWEIGVRQRKDKNLMAQKDDTLLEVMNSYIDQSITYLGGKNIFSSILQNKRNQEKTIDEALKAIINNFLIPNYQYPSSENQKDVDINQKCRILTILANGGSGKSMLLKKLEMELIQSNSEYIKDERAKYIPLTIKCNSLDAKNPSIEDFLMSQSLEKDQIESLKKSERNKLILLDGYDEYSGDYFKVFHKFKIYEWVNTLVLVTSRFEKISVSDAKIYFNYYDENELNPEIEDQSSIVKLEQFSERNIQDYLIGFKDELKEIKQEKFDESSYKKIQEIILQNKSLLKLLKLPINLYLTTRMIMEIDIKKEKTVQTLKNASDQIELQELFFQQQFEKKSKEFVSQLSIDDEMKRNEIQNSAQLSYFEYFQFIAMGMFKQKGISNCFQANKQQINFQLRCDLGESINNKLLEKLNNFVDSTVIVGINLQQDAQEADNQTDNENVTPQVFEFRHKSLFEYFTARAIKYDFDIHKENIYQLSLDELKQFNINQASIMKPGYNNSEQQILLKFFKLIDLDRKNGIADYTKNYNCSKIEENNRYIQYIRSSQIESQEEISEIDIGSSNLISCLFVSRFAFDNLTFTQCSFSKAYLINKSNESIIFKKCNLKNSLLLKMNYSSVKKSNINYATFTPYPKVFDSDQISHFRKIVFFQQNTILTTNELGYINCYRINEKSKSMSIIKSKRIANEPLNEIFLCEDKNQFLVTANTELLLVASNDFRVIKSEDFESQIEYMDYQNKQCVIQLENKNSFYGNFEQGFKAIQIKGCSAKLSKNCEFIITCYKDEAFVFNINNNFKETKTIKCTPNSHVIQVFFSPNGQYLVTSLNNRTCRVWDIKKDFSLVNTTDDHYYEATSVSFSANSKYLATGSADQTCKVFDIENNFELLKTIKVYKGSVLSSSFSTDGKYLATGSKMGLSIYIIKQNFELLNQIDSHKESIKSMALSPDGNILATGSSGDKTCKIWNAKNGFELITTIEEFLSYIAFSPNSKYMATGQWDRSCKIWNVQKNFELVISLEDDQYKKYCFSFSDDGKYLATCSGDNSFIIWNINQGFKLQNTIKGHSDSVNSVAFSLNSQYLATCSDDQTFKIWNAQKNFELMNTIQAHNQSVLSVTFSANGKYLATNSDDFYIKIWNSKKGFELIKSILVKDSIVSCNNFSADGKYLASAACYQCLIWDIGNDFELLNDIELEEYIYSVAFSPDCKQIATGCGDKSFKIWNADKAFELINTAEYHRKDILSVSFSTDGKYLATTSDGGTIKIWNIALGFEEMNIISQKMVGGNSLAFSRDSKYLAISLIDISIWSIEEGFKLVKNLKGHKANILSTAFSPDGKYLATGSADGTCKIWNVVKEFEQITSINCFSGEDALFKQITFSRDGKYLAVCENSSNFWILSVEKGFQLINTLQGHSELIFQIAFSANSKYLASCSKDKSCVIWDVKQGFKLITVKKFDAIVFSVSFSLDDRYLALGSADETCKIWNVEKGFELIHTIQGRTNQIWQIVFTPDSKFLISRRDGNLILQDYKQSPFQWKYIL